MMSVLIPESSMIEKLITEGEPVVFKDYKLLKNTEEYIVASLAKYLEFIGKERISDHLSYCLREIMINAKKANTKRVYFKDIKLNINNDEQYKIAMKDFKNTTLSDIDRFLDMQEQAGLYIQVVLKLTDQFFEILVSNNAPLIKSEADLIMQKVIKAKSFNSLEEAFQSVLDDTEGAGLGLVILILMMRKLGIGTKHFTVSVKDNHTNVKIAVPLSLATEEEIDMISDSLIQEINSIPHFPDNILKLNQMLANKDTDFKEISKHIMKDAGLSFEVLRMANSAHYRTLNRIERVDLAVNILGSKGLYYISQSFGAVSALTKKYAYKDIQTILEHSVEIANISSILCNRYNMTAEGDYAYTGGLLHDIGKILLKSLHPKTIERATKMCLEKNVSIRVIEDMISGSNHAKIGSLVAKKWNIPEKIINLIKFHEDIFRAPNEIKDIVSILILSHIIYSINHEENALVEPEEKKFVMNRFKITDEAGLTTLAEIVKKELERITK